MTIHMNHSPMTIGLIYIMCMCMTSLLEWNHISENQKNKLSGKNF